MKVFFYLPNVESGGAEKMIIALANEMANNGNDVTLVLGVFEGAFKEDISNQVKIFELGTLSVLKSVTKLFKIISKNEPDVLCVTKCHVNTILAPFALFFRKTNIVLREANTPTVEFKYAGLYAKMIMLLAKLTYKFADKYIGVSNGVSEDMISFYGLKDSKVQTIYNPVISPKLYELSKEEVYHPFFDEKKKNSATYILVAVGRLMPQKDYPTMIESFHEAYKQNNNLRLVILGRVEKYNSDYDIVVEKIKKYNLKAVISFVGFVSNPYNYLLKADCFIQTSLFEGLPGTLVQALGLRKNIIATNCKSGPTEILNNGEFGALVELGNIEQISEQILKYSEGKSNMKANEDFLNQFTLDASTKQYELLFCRLMMQNETNS